MGYPCMRHQRNLPSIPPAFLDSGLRRAVEGGDDGVPP